MNTDVSSAALTRSPSTGGAGLPEEPATLARAIVDNLFYRQGRLAEFATANDWYMAVAHTVRDRLVDRFVNTARVLTLQNTKMVCYLSAEFLVGPQLMQNVINLG